MTRFRSFFVTLVIVATVFVGACAKKGDKPNPGQRSGTETANLGLVNAIKKGKLINYQSTTIGDAFDSYKYLTKKEWKAAILKSRHMTVDFTGWFEPDTLNDKDIKDGIRGRGIDVKFVINPDGSYYVFMVLKIESKSDGKVYGYELRESAGILANIYANKKIIF